MAGRNRDNVRSVKRQSQARYDERLKLLGVPRSEDIARALLNAIRNHRAQIVNTEQETRVLSNLLAKASELLIDQGYSAAGVKEKLTRIIRRPKRPSIAEMESRNAELAARGLLEPGRTTSILHAMKVVTGGNHGS